MNYIMKSAFVVFPGINTLAPNPAYSTYDRLVAVGSGVQRPLFSGRLWRAELPQQKIRFPSTNAQTSST